MSFFGRVGLFALSAAVLVIGTDVLVAGRLSPDARSWYAFAVRVALYGLAMIAAASAASRLGWAAGHVARAWSLFSLQFLFLLVNYVLRRAAPSATVGLEVTLVAANVAEVAGYWLMARVLAAVGMGSLVSTAKRVLLTVAALAVAILLCHATLLLQWQALRSGDVRVGSLVSVLTDIITFTLIAPLAMSTLALRGGSLSWIFGFLTVSVFGWMINTGAESISSLLSGDPGTLRAVRMAGVVIASIFNAAAATTQSLLTIRATKGVGADA